MTFVEFKSMQQCYRIKYVLKIASCVTLLLSDKDEPKVNTIHFRKFWRKQFVSTVERLKIPAFLWFRHQGVITVLKPHACQTPAEPSQSKYLRTVWTREAQCSDFSLLPHSFHNTHSQWEPVQEQTSHPGGLELQKQPAEQAGETRSAEATLALCTLRLTDTLHN